MESYRYIVPVLLVMLSAGILLSGCDQKKQTKCLPIVAVYPTWHSSKLPIENIPWNKFTVIAVAFIIPNDDGTINSTDADKLLPQLVEEAHRHNKKVYISIGGAVGYGDAFQKITQDTKKLSTFAHLIRDYALKNSIDGIDIDWEFWTKQQIDKQGGNDPIESKLLVKLLATLRRELPGDMILTADVFAGNWFGEQYLSEIQEYVNYVVLMSYDFTGAWEQSAIAHHADFSTFKKSITFITDRGFKKEKIIAGIPSYSIEFIDGKNKQVNKELSFSDIEKLAREKNIDINTGKIGNIFYETPALVENKTQYILNENLAGVMFFELTQDSNTSHNSLLTHSNKIISPDFCRGF